MPNFSSKNFGFTPFMNEMSAIVKPELPYLYSKLLKACALLLISNNETLIFISGHVIVLIEEIITSVLLTMLT